MIPCKEVSVNSVVACFPSVTTFPHHFHDQNDKITASNLMGDIIEDIDYVLGEIKRLLIEGDLS